MRRPGPLKLIQFSSSFKDKEPLAIPRPQVQTQEAAATITHNNDSALQFIGVHRTAGHSGMLHPKACSKSLFKPKYKVQAEKQSS